MRKSSLCAALVLSVASLAAQAQDVAGAEDYALFPRLPGFVITRYAQEPATTVLPVGNQKKQTVTGLRTTIDYTFQGARGRSLPTRTEVEGHYLNTTLELGQRGQTFETFRTEATYTVRGRHDGKVLWLHTSDFRSPPKVAGRVASFRLTVVETAPEK